MLGGGGVGGGGGVKLWLKLNNFKVHNICMTHLLALLLKPFISGVVPLDLLAIIRILAKNGQFSIFQYNEALKRLGFRSYESSDKPCPVPVTYSKKVTKLKGKAISHWVHVRNWPLIIRNIVKDQDDPVVNLGLKLHEIVERLTANEFLPYEIDLLAEKVIQYFELRKTLRVEYPNIMPNPKPKHHYLRKNAFIIIYWGR